MGQIEYHLKPLPPFRLDLTVWVLRRRPDNAIDLWDGQTYRRALIVEGEVTAIEVTQTGTLESPSLTVTATGSLSSNKLKAGTSVIVKKILGTQVDLTDFYRFAENEKDLGPLVRKFRGVKPPRFPNMFEALVNSISCQQISLNICVRLLNRLVARWGPVITLPDQGISVFPRPQDLTQVQPDNLRNMGYSYNKARAILELTALINSGKLNLDEITSMDDANAVSRLRELRGVGLWTAEYSLLRGNGRIHLFPTGDSGALGNLQLWLSQGKLLSPEEVKRILASWFPYAGMVYFHLLLHKLDELGYLF